MRQALLAHLRTTRKRCRFIDLQSISTKNHAIICFGRLPGHIATAHIALQGGEIALQWRTITAAATGTQNVRVTRLQHLVECLAVKKIHFLAFAKAMQRHTVAQCRQAAIESPRLAFDAIHLRAEAYGVARAPADGYTLLINTVPTVANPALFKLSFVPERDFAPISLVMNGPNVLVVHPSLPVRTIKDFVALAKARPGDIKYTSAGAGTLPHLGMELLRYMTKINLLHVAYKGGGPAMVALVSGECDASMYTLLTASPHIASGRLRAIGVSGKTRFKALPDVPTIAESGVPDYEFNAWVGLLAPAATPPAIIRLLNEHVVKAARSSVAAERLTRDGAEVVASTPEAFRARIAADTALWAKVIKEMNLRAE